VPFAVVGWVGPAMYRWMDGDADHPTVMGNLVGGGEYGGRPIETSGKSVALLCVKRSNCCSVW